MLPLGFRPNLNCILCVTQVRVLSLRDWVRTQEVTCRKLTKTVLPPLEICTHPILIKRGPPTPHHIYRWTQLDELRRMMPHLTW